MASFPLAALQKVRQIRLDSCAREVQAKQQAVVHATQAVEQAQLKIEATLDQRHRERALLHRDIERPASQLEQQQVHIGWLDDRLEHEHKALAKSEENLDNAKQDLREKQREYRKFDAKVQALDTVKKQWLKRQLRDQEFAQDSDAEELSTFEQVSSNA